MKTEDLARLAEPFLPEDVEWKPGAVTRDKSKALAMAYITNRAIQDRLDAVCGPGDWRNEYTTGPDGGVLCGISIRVERTDSDGKTSAEWITKWDGAENTAVESIKGGLSGAMKRAAVQWGIGRYLYRLPQQWVPLDERGRFRQEPRIPREFLPSGNAQGNARPSEPAGDGAATSAPHAAPAAAPARPAGAARRAARPKPQRPAPPARDEAAPPAPEKPEPKPSAPSRSGPDAAEFFPGDLPF